MPTICGFRWRSFAVRHEHRCFLIFGHTNKHKCILLSDEKDTICGKEY